MADEAAPLPSLWGRASVVAGGAALALALALVVVAVGAAQEDLPRAGAGDVFSAPLPSDPPAHPGTVVLPWNRMSLSVGQPREDVPEEIRDSSLVAPPEDGSFVQVDLRPLAKDTQRTPFPSLGQPWRTDAEVVLTADGTSYPVDGPAGLGVSPESPSPSGSTTRWVAVDGHPEDLEVTVRVDGQEQTVDADGTVTRRRATDLLRLPTVTEQQAATPPGSCGRVRQRGSSEVRIAPGDEPACDVVGSLRTPFVDGLGWARAGHDFLVVQVAPDENLDLSGREGERWTGGVRVDARLGNGRYVRSTTSTGGMLLGTAPRTPVRQVAIEVPSDRDTEDLHLRMRIEAVREQPVTPRPPQRLELGWTIPGQVLS